MKRVYIAGPCSGLPEFNYPAFHAKAAELRAAGYHVENPAENPEPVCKSWQGYMRLAVAQLATCDAVVLLPGWSKSRGACVEHQLAVGMGLEVLEGYQVAIEAEETFRWKLKAAELEVEIWRSTEASNRTQDRTTR